MSLETRLLALVQAVATDIKSLFARAIPSGGATGQVLVKNSASDHDVAWADPAGGGGSGDVVGPSTANDGAIATFDGATGKLLQEAPFTAVRDEQDGRRVLRGFDEFTGTGGDYSSAVTELRYRPVTETEGVPEEPVSASAALYQGAYVEHASGENRDAGYEFTAISETVSGGAALDMWYYEYDENSDPVHEHDLVMGADPDGVYVGSIGARLDLTVNGSKRMSVTDFGEILLWYDGPDEPASGEPGQVLTSGGPGEAAYWADVAGRMPVRATEDRPDPPEAGMFQLNSTTGEPEWYDEISDTWRPFTQGASTYTIEYLVVAGGGGGGFQDVAAGGGGGGVVSGTASVTTGDILEVTVGAGGPGGSTAGSRGSNGGDSSLGELATAIGGGGGGVGNSGSLYTGLDGGSGGGGSWSGAAGGAGTTGQGNAGGQGYTTGAPAGGGGGGAGAQGGKGGSVSSGVGGVGGAGTDYPEWASATDTGESGLYGGGGGGGGDNGGGAGGLGGGGVGGYRNGNPPLSNMHGDPNTGGGGGGSGGYSGGPGGNGGSGIVIIRYEGTQRATGGFTEFSNGYTYHTFTSSANFVA